MPNLLVLEFKVFQNAMNSLKFCVFILKRNNFMNVTHPLSESYLLLNLNHMLYLFQTETGINDIVGAQ